MPKVSKLPAGRKGLSHRAKQDDTDSTSDQFDDAAEDTLVPALPAILKGSSSLTGSVSSADKEDGKEGSADGGGGSGRGLGGLSLSLGLGGGLGSGLLGLSGKKLGASSNTMADKPAAGGARKPGGLLNSNPPSSLANDFRGGQESWNAMLYQLLLYKAQRGDLNIPHNDTSYRLLYNWVQTQRKHYKLYQENKTSSTFLNADRIAVLDAIDFQWNVRGDTFWQKNFDALISYKNEHGDVRVPRLYTKNPKLGEWVTDQRRQWKAKMEGKPNMMTEERKSKLDELGFVWKVRDRADWNDRYEQLLEFKKENGHCIVPQHYTRNRALGKWVAKQREQYRFYREGKHSFLTEERIDLLKSVGFVWQIKGRGANKKLPGKSPAAAGLGIMNDDKEKSLAKIEEEEKAKEAKNEESANPFMATLGMGMAGDEMKMKSSTPPLDSMGLNPPSLGPSGSMGMMGMDLGMGMGMGTTGTDSSMSLPKSKTGDNKSSGLPSLPPISQQQLLQANMAAIAAHASSNQNMVADLAAALRLGGSSNPNAVPGLGDPRAVAALRAQLGSDPSKGSRSFTTML